MNSPLPAWFKQDIPDAAPLKVSHILSEFAVHTVCRLARCPNLSRCFGANRAAFMILGDTCTRHCSFCAVGSSQGKPLFVDEEEPYKIREAAKFLGLNYVVVTSVTRDDLPDGGAGQFAKTIGSLRSINENIRIEALIPDFQGVDSSLKRVTEASPDVLAHNMETVERLYTKVRPAADYRRSQEVLRKVKEWDSGIITKSSLMLGMGETRQEVLAVIRDLKLMGCDILTLGQYLAPSKNHYPVQEFISCDGFKEYEAMALSMGFKAVLSGPLVRSSYRAGEVYERISHA